MLLRCYGEPGSSGSQGDPRTYTSDTVGQQAEPESQELAKLRDELRSCRLELAERHRELETLHEERHELLRRCEAAELQVRAMSAGRAEAPPTEDQPAPSRLFRRRDSK